MHGCQIAFGSSRSASSCSLPCWGSLQACCSVPRPCGRGIPAAAGKKVLAPTRLTTLPRDIKVRRGFRCRGKKQRSPLSQLFALGINLLLFLLIHFLHDRI